VMKATFPASRVMDLAPRYENGGAYTSRLASRQTLNEY